MDDLPTLGAMSRFECRRVLQLLEIVFVGSVPDVHLCIIGVPTFLAVLPGPFMAFIVMNPAKGVAVMVPIAAIPCIRERDILVMVVADPILAAVGFPEFPGFATKTTGTASWSWVSV